MRRFNSDFVSRLIRPLQIGFLLALIGAIFLFMAPSSLADLMRSFGTELISIALTIMVIDRIYDLKTRQERKEQLIRQLGTNDNGLALFAVKELRAEGWLEDGSMQGAMLKKAELFGADLSGARLQKANLQQASLRDANMPEVLLNDADLSQADLHGARLTDSQLIRARLYEAKLTEANCVSVNFQHADLSMADLAGSFLMKADLSNASLNEAILRKANLNGASLQNTILRAVDLTDALVDEEQFKAVGRLYAAIMPGGERYDGRFNLAGDLDAARSLGVDIENDEAMAMWYEVSLETYKLGQAI